MFQWLRFLLQAPLPDSPAVPQDTGAITNPFVNLLKSPSPTVAFQQVGSFVDKLWELSILYAPKLFMGILVLYFGFKIIRKMVTWLESVMTRNKFDKDLAPFVATLISVVLKVFLFLSAADIIGIATTSFVAILATAGLAVGLALQGSLSNLAGGILILIFKPFKTGDLIRTQEYLGVIKQIQILNTILVTNQNYQIVIPNSLITTGVIENLTGAGVIRVDLVYGVDYSTDLDLVYRTLQKVISICPYAVIDETHKHEIQLRTLNNSSVDFATCIWCEAKHYFDIKYYMNDQVKRAFDEAGISIPFPQMDVHLRNPPKA
jgi:small conductance mechanosensitive channel